MPTQKIVPQTESTQTDLKQLLKADSFLPHLSYVHALEQTAGRGRQGNTWISKPGNLYLSVLYRYGDLDAGVSKNLTWMPLWVGSQVRQALASLGLQAGQVQLKWPNDLLFNQNEKFGGILCEKIQQNLVIGIGMNLAHAPGQLGTERPVTCLSKMSPEGARITVEKLRDAILVHLDKKFDLEALKKDLARHMIPKAGTEVQWIDLLQNGARKSGMVAGLGGFGELQVTCGDQIIQLFSEEVTLKK